MFLFSTRVFHSVESRKEIRPTKIFSCSRIANSCGSLCWKSRSCTPANADLSSGQESEGGRKGVGKGQKMMRGRRRSFIAGLGFLMLMGTAVYFRLWAIDYNVSSDDAELLRRQFDLANREAMDESAEWRLKYDEEADKATKCFKELQAIKGSSQKLESSSSVNHKYAMLQKENAVLHERLETLKRELEEEKLKCQAQSMF